MRWRGGESSGVEQALPLLDLLHCLNDHQGAFFIDFEGDVTSNDGIGSRLYESRGWRHGAQSHAGGGTGPFRIKRQTHPSADHSTIPSADVAASVSAAKAEAEEAKPTPIGKSLREATRARSSVPARARTRSR